MTTGSFEGSESVAQTLVHSEQQPDGSEIRMYLAQRVGSYCLVEIQRYKRREDGAMIPVGMLRAWMDKDSQQVYRQVLAALQAVDEKRE